MFITIETRENSKRNVSPISPALVVQQAAIGFYLQRNINRAQETSKETEFHWTYKRKKSNKKTKNDMKILQEYDVIVVLLLVCRTKKKIWSCSAGIYEMSMKGYETGYSWKKHIWDNTISGNFERFLSIVFVTYASLFLPELL